MSNISNYLNSLSRWLFLCMLSVTSARVSADVTLVEDRSDDRGVRMVYKMTVSPAPEPVPALKYRLTIEPHKTLAANAATLYLRSFGEGSLTGPWAAAEKQFGEEVYRWGYDNEIAIKDLPIDKLREAAGLFDSYVDNHIRRATKCRTCEWGLAEQDLRGVEAISFLLPSAQQTRSISRALALRTRLAVADGRFDDAIDHLRMSYQLGQNVSRMNFLVTSLIGIAEVGIANIGMLDLIAAQDSPNMYWALAELPRPIIDIRDAMRLDMSLGPRILPVMLDVDAADYSEQQWADQVAHVVNVMSRMMEGFDFTDMDEPSIETKFWALGAGLAGYTNAKKRLIEAGLPPNLAEEMAVGKVLIMDAARDYQRAADEQEKAFYVPYGQSGRFIDDAEQRLREESRQMRLGIILAHHLLPAISQVRQAQVRIEWQINALQIIEAIRMHLASTGELPKTPDEIRLPLPLNPFTNQPYSYKIDGDKAILDMPFSDGVAGMAQRFEIQVAPQ